MNNHDQPAADWGQASLAGLPHLLIGVMFSLPALFAAAGARLPMLETGGGSYYFTDIVCSITILVLLGLAWRKGWPGWSASLYGYSFLILAIATAGAVNKLLSYGIDSTRGGMIFFLVLILSLVGLLVALVVRHPLSALLGILPLVYLGWEVILEFTSPGARAAAVLLAGLLTAVAAVWILRKGKLQSGILTGLGVTLLVGLIFATARTYFANRELYPFLESRGLAELLELLVLPFAALSTLVLGPFLLRALHQVGRQTGHPRGFRLVLAGFILELVCLLVAHVWLQQAHDTIRDLRLGDTIGIVAAWGSYLGAGILLAGAGWLAVEFRDGQSQPVRRNILLGAGLLVLLPPVVVLALAFGYRNIPAVMPFGMRWLQDQPAGFTYALAGAWVVLAAWMTVKWIKAEDSPPPDPIDGGQTTPSYSSPAR